MMKRVVVLSILVFLVLGVLAFHRFRPADRPGDLFHTSPIKHGDLVKTVASTGTVEPEEVIDVGAQVAGQIVSFGQDIHGKTVDYGSEVREGTVLARIDESIYVAEVARAEAETEVARANYQRVKAELGVMKAKLYQAERDWRRAQGLARVEALAGSAFDAYKSAYEAAKANIEVSESAIRQAEASVAQGEATLRRARLNLGYCTITSPVQGVIIDRRVNIGQTVVASLNAPSLFLLAKDLKRVRVWVAVNEADIGKIKTGQPVDFTVDALPGQRFNGQVDKIRLNATMTQNVVMYTVEVVTDNAERRLLPYLTANVRFEVERRNNVLMAPNGALRWKPSEEQIEPEFRAVRREVAKTVSDRGILWVRRGDYVRPLKVRIGLTDGVMTEVSGDGVAEGAVTVTATRTEEGTEQVGEGEAKNPFLTRLPPGPGGKGGGPSPR
ncbi:MAG: efflux RND transporter periplasmic adaptor subunit [Thermodesulfobacteriota bacterium]